MPKRDSPCTECGKLGYPSQGSKSSRRCLECRRTNFAHGINGYTRRKCRCEVCRSANADAMRRYVAKAKGRGVRYGSGGEGRVRGLVRLQVFERDGWLCQLCGDPVDPNAGPQTRSYPSIDHKVPQSLGGTDDLTNLQTAHRWCNSIRQARALEGLVIV